MSIDTAIYDRLRLSSGSLFPLVALRIYPVRFPQNVTFPCVTFQIVTSQRISAMGSDTAIVMSRVQVDGWHTTYDGARSLSAAIIDQLQRWRASSPDVIHDSFIENESSEMDDDAELFRAFVEAKISYNE